MGDLVIQLYRRIDAGMEYCFNIESGCPLSDTELQKLKLVLADGFMLETVAISPFMTGERVVEVGPRLNFATVSGIKCVRIT